MAKSSKFSVTFEVLTPESVEAGDMADHGFVDPRTGKERSLRKGGKRVYERNVRMARKGAFDWSVKAAVEWLDSNAGGPVVQAEYNVGDMTLRVDLHQDGADIIVGKNGYEEESKRTNYSLFCEGVSEGTARRILRALRAPAHVGKWLVPAEQGTSPYRTEDYYH